MTKHFTTGPSGSSDFCFIPWENLKGKGDGLEETKLAVSLARGQS